MLPVLDEVFVLAQSSNAVTSILTIRGCYADPDVPQLHFFHQNKKEH
jgi:hypothetical protein